MFSKEEIVDILYDIVQKRINLLNGIKKNNNEKCNEKTKVKSKTKIKTNKVKSKTKSKNKK